MTLLESIYEYFMCWFMNSMGFESPNQQYTSNFNQNIIFLSIYSIFINIYYTILMFAAILTMVGNLVADMLYAVADPRVTFK